MNIQDIKNNTGYTCVAVNEDLLFVETPYCLAFDGMCIGAYLESIGREKIRITDNSNVLWTAMAQGIQESTKLAKKIKGIVEPYGYELSDDGEIFAACDEKNAGYYLARFVEAASEVGYICQGYKPGISSDFERTIAAGLASHYKERLKRSCVVIGASGHQLTFPFALDANSKSPTYLQTIAAPEGQPNWKTVYHTLGKMTDLSNSAVRARKIVILERGLPDEMQKVTSALGTAANVLIYDNYEQLAGLAA